MYKKYGKRIFDIILAAAGLIILSPLFVFLMLLLSIFGDSNPFFFQTRPGLNSQLFSIIKFKTMLDLSDINGNNLSDDKRITRIGKLMRRTSLDEIPQLWNVLLGDMSLIGPRPLLEEYLPVYTTLQVRRQEVKPGITGWAQINGRNAISWEEKFAYDLYYVENISFAFDFKILLKTVQKVIIHDQNSYLSEKFRG